MAYTLEANLSTTNPTTFFSYPSDSTKFVHCILDPCHSLKFTRNAWCSMHVIYDDGDKNKKYWGCIEKLVTLQEN